MAPRPQRATALKGWAGLLTGGLAGQLSHKLVRNPCNPTLIMHKVTDY